MRKKTKQVISDNEVIIYRARHCISQKAFAKAARVTTATINRIENGRRPLRRATVAKIRAILDKE